MLFFCSVLLSGRIRRNLQANLLRVLLRDEIAKRTASVENITFRCAIYFYRNINVLASVESHSGIFQSVETDTKLSLHHKSSIFTLTESFRFGYSSFNRNKSPLFRISPILKSACVCEYAQLYPSRKEASRYKSLFAVLILIVNYLLNTRIKIQE